MSASGATARAARRQVLATVLLPALLLAAIYMIALRLKLTRDITALETQLASAEAQLPDAATQSRLAQELSEARTQVEAARTRSATDPEPVPSPSSPAERSQRRLSIGAILARNELLLVQEEHSPVDVGAQVAPLLVAPPPPPTPAQPAAPPAPGSAAPPRSRPAPVLRARVPAATLTLRGGYLEMLSALENLRDAGLGIVPLRIEMRRDESVIGEDGLAGIEWTLVLA